MPKDNDIELRLQKVSSDLEHSLNNQERLTAEFKNLNAKIDQITSGLGKLDGFQIYIQNLEKRVEQLEKLRWWVGTLIVGAIILAIVKGIMK